MRYVSADGMQEYLGENYFDWEDSVGDADRALEDCETRLLAYIIPNAPQCEEQIAAFCCAVYAQLEYESGEVASELKDMPSGLTGFTVNGFSATLDANSGDAASRAGLCRSAVAELLYSGLLYRGVISC